MRVISGSAKGRTLKAVPGQNTRPTTDKVKESIFNMIGPYFEGGIVLDLFAGTGGLAIEALSRGMNKGILIDQSKQSIETIKKNLVATGLEEQTEVYLNEAFRSLKLLKKRGIAFDLVLLDPPYRLKILEDILLFLTEKNMLADQAFVVTEHDAKYQFNGIENIKSLELVKSVTYGDIGVTIFRNLA